MKGVKSGSREWPEGGMPMSEDSVVAKSCSLAVSVERERDGDPCNSQDARVIDLLETMEPPEDSDIGIGASKSKKPNRRVATSAHSTGNSRSHRAAGKLSHS